MGKDGIDGKKRHQIPFVPYGLKTVIKNKKFISIVIGSRAKPALVIFGIIFFFLLNVVAILSATPQRGRSDLIVIDTMTSFGPLKRTPVTFLHTSHTEALLKENMTCTSCHLTVDNKLLPKFNRVSDESAKKVMDSYHDNCIACHTDFKAKNKKTGPVSCGGCHTKESSYFSTRKPFGMDLSLHFRHTRSLENKCETCHHEYDESNKKLIYVKGKEASCRYCHKEENFENKVAFEQAAHASCISCHLGRVKENKSAGPSQCMGCHDAKEQKYITRVTDIPRMDRKQPDVVLVRAFKKEAGELTSELPGLKERMTPVVFNHQGHETYSKTCVACHHESLEACGSCHTPTPIKKGGFVSLEKAMHDPQSPQSCISCHEQEQQKKECAGCHEIAQKNLPKANESCAVCHSEQVFSWVNDSENDTGENLDAALKTRPVTKSTYAASDIPEKVLIKGLSDQYEPVELPHGKIIQKLLAGISENQLAGNFHKDPGTLCQGCHHNSPPSKTPPKCGSCHDKPFQLGAMNRPGLLGAYHQQCMKCHEQMEIKKPASRDCTACHKKKA